MPARRRSLATAGDRQSILLKGTVMLRLVLILLRELFAIRFGRMMRTAATSFGPGRSWLERLAGR